MTRVRVGPLAALGVLPRLVDLTAAGPHGPQAIVLRDRTGTLQAYLNRCQHLPVPLDAASGELLADDRVHLICLTHGATYRPEDGLCVEGPCEGEHLERLALETKDGTLWVVAPERCTPKFAP
jgi:nitrite reductase/ring-hydroxylating ferredoxin subunit